MLVNGFTASSRGDPFPHELVPVVALRWPRIDPKAFLSCPLSSLFETSLTKDCSVSLALLCGRNLERATAAQAEKTILRVVVRPERAIWLDGSDVAAVPAEGARQIFGRHRISFWWTCPESNRGPQTVVGSERYVRSQVGLAASCRIRAEGQGSPANIQPSVSREALGNRLGAEMTRRLPPLEAPPRGHSVPRLFKKPEKLRCDCSELRSSNVVIGSSSVITFLRGQVISLGTLSVLFLSTSKPVHAQMCCRQVPTALRGPSGPTPDSTPASPARS